MVLHPIPFDLVIIVVSIVVCLQPETLVNEGERPKQKGNLVWAHNGMVSEFILIGTFHVPQYFNFRLV